MVVVQWSSFLSSTPTIRVRNLLTTTIIFCKICAWKKRGQAWPIKKLWDDFRQKLYASRSDCLKAPMTVNCDTSLVVTVTIWLPFLRQKIVTCLKDCPLRPTRTMCFISKIIFAVKFWWIRERKHGGFQSKFHARHAKETLKGTGAKLNKNC